MQMKKSFVNKILIYLMILTSLLIAVLGVFLISSYGIMKKEIKDSSDAFLRIYSNEFNNNIAEMDGLLKSITTQGEDLAKIKSNDGNQRSLASISLHNYMLELIAGKDVADVIIVSDGNYNVCLDAIKNGFNYKKKNSLRDFTSKAISNDDIHSFEWSFLNLNNEIYMYKILRTESRVIAIYKGTGRLLNSLSTEENGNRAIVLVNDSGVIGKIWGNETEDIRVGADIHQINTDHYYIVNNTVADGQLKIYCYTGKNNILRQTHAGMIIVAVTVCMTMIFMIFILGFTRKEIAVPMQIMVSDMERIRNGEYENRIDDNFHSSEFQMLKEAANRMVDEIIGLKIQTYEKKIELQDMELKSIRLQLKPHFFLNALTTISSLSSQSKNEQIKMYIDALSKNVRYMFRAGFHTVPIREEIKHVKNYFEMQELKYPGCVFYLEDLPGELGNWMVPQMLIHTFIENEYKYAVSMDAILTILIKVSKTKYKEEDMLLIEIEDDGKGYPKEVLDYMNGHEEKVSEKGMRIGLWSIKRMMELMYEKEGLIVIENIKPHGCLNRIYVPYQAKHELTEETIQTKL